jgi:hypothetical protein
MERGKWRENPGNEEQWKTIKKKETVYNTVDEVEESDNLSKEFYTRVSKSFRTKPITK